MKEKERLGEVVGKEKRKRVLKKRDEINRRHFPAQKLL
jgi:hypothetical protein